MTKILACITARMQSTRLPGKVLKPIAGKPMNRYIYERLMRDSDSVHNVCYCIPMGEGNDVLRKTVSEWGAVYQSSANEDVLKNFIDAGDQNNADILLRITGDNIFTSPEYIDAMVDKHLQTNADYSRVQGLPLGMTAEAMNLSMLKDLHNHIDDPAQTQYLLMYAFDPDRYKCTVLEPQKKHNKPFISVTVDTQEDWDRTERILNTYSSEEWGPKTNKIFEWFEAHQQDVKRLEPETEIKMPHGKTVTYQGFLGEMQSRTEKSNYIREDEYDLG